MSGKVKSLVGRKFGKLTVVSLAAIDHGARWRCKCECGNFRTVRADILHRAANTGIRVASCNIGDCYHAVIHNQRFSRTYNSWRCMKARCNRSSHHKFKLYGGRGIKICERWLTFVNFLEDMGERLEGTTLDRIDGDKGYFKENCRWATAKTQNENREQKRAA